MLKILDFFIKNVIILIMKVNGNNITINSASAQLSSAQLGSASL